VIKEEVFGPLYHKHNNRTYSVHDVAIASNNGREIKAALSYSVDGGELLTTCTEYSFKKIGKTPIHQLWFQDSHLAEIGGLVDEVMGELKEEAAVQRDLNKDLS
jgi:hypothetical protein